MNPFIQPSSSTHQYKLSSSLKQKMKAFTNLIAEQNPTRYDYIEMLQKSYGALLTEQSKTGHFCDICKKTIYGKAFGPHKKSHYKNGEVSNKDNNNGNNDKRNEDEDDKDQDQNQKEDKVVQ